MDGGELLTLKAVAALLQVSEKTARRLIEDECFPRPVMIGRSPRWYEMDVTAYKWMLGRGLLSPKKQVGESGQGGTGKDKQGST